MSLLDILRADGRTRPDGVAVDPPPVWLVPLVAGAVTAALSAALTLLATLLTVISASRSTVGWDQSIGTGASLWLLAGGARLVDGPIRVAFTPLLLTAVLVGVVSLVAARTISPEGERRRPVGAWVLGYAGASLVVAVLTFLAPVRPVAWSLALPVLGVPMCGVAVVLARRGDLGDLVRPRVPRLVMRSARPALVGVAALLGSAGVLVVGTVVARFGQVTHVTTQLDAGPVGTGVVWLVQALALPNLALWALGLVAGPGFSVAEGAHVAWSGAETTLMPMVPVLGALPSPGPFPWAVHLLVLVPVGVGVLIARRSLAALPRLSPLRAKLGVTLAATGASALVVGCLDAVAGGSLGSVRLSDIGVPAAGLATVLFLELSLGAAVVLARDWWVLRR